MLVIGGDDFIINICTSDRWGTASTMTRHDRAVRMTQVGQQKGWEGKKTRFHSVNFHQCLSLNA